jgi:hypothetical protein
MMHDRTPERPRYEPEIIPPDPRRAGGFHPRPRDFGADDGFAFDRQFATNDNREQPRVLIWRPSPIKIALLLLAVGLVVGAGVAILFGAILLAAPIVAIGLVALIVGLKVRRFWSRLSGSGGTVPRRR